jgi:valyl-tRNA synthetase
VSRLENLLGSSFSERAPAAIVHKEREKLANFQETVEKLSKQLDNLD